ncbi:MAG: ATP-dependent Clp protease proteolytic subunit [Candidatus Thermoplasmatota archaeon]|nr:ATP-dependent Clp protease proteolytic subunit [Candidatus Thermoplasmatota archaeon]
MCRRESRILIAMALALAFAFCVFETGYAGLGSASALTSNSPGLVVVNFDIGVDQGSANYVQSASSYAISSHDNIVIVMNTPGGLLDDMLTIVSAIQDVQSHGLRVYTYVPPDGAAASAGSYIALATNAIYMGNGSVIGPSTPYIIGGTSLEEQHVKNFSVAYIGALASRNGYNVSAAENMAENNVAYNASNAAAIGLITGKAQTFDQFLFLAGLQGSTVINLSEPLYDTFLSTVSNATLDGLFFIVGAVAIFIDLFHRTLFLTFFGAIMIALGLLGAEVIGAPVVAVLVLAAAAVLIFIEVKAGHGLFAISGILLGLLGTWLLAGNSIGYSKHLPAGYSPSPFGLLEYLLMGLVAGLLIIGAVYIAKIRRVMMDSPRLVGVHRVIGATGWSTTELMPGSDGVCNVLSEDWTCFSDRPIPKNTRIRVIEYRDGKIRVEPADGSEQKTAGKAEKS